jgi:hypothetical protein
MEGNGCTKAAILLGAAIGGAILIMMGLFGLVGGAQAQGLLWNTRVIYPVTGADVVVSKIEVNGGSHLYVTKGGDISMKVPSVGDFNFDALQTHKLVVEVAPQGDQNSSVLAETAFVSAYNVMDSQQVWTFEYSPRQETLYFGGDYLHLFKLLDDSSRYIDVRTGETAFYQSGHSFFTAAGTKLFGFGSYYSIDLRLLSSGKTLAVQRDQVWLIDGETAAELLPCVDQQTTGCSYYIDSVTNSGFTVVDGLKTKLFPFNANGELLKLDGIFVNVQDGYPYPVQTEGMEAGINPRNMQVEGDIYAGWVWHEDDTSEFAIFNTGWGRIPGGFNRTVNIPHVVEHFESAGVYAYVTQDGGLHTVHQDKVFSVPEHTAIGGKEVWSGDSLVYQTAEESTVTFTALGILVDGVTGSRLVDYAGVELWSVDMDLVTVNNRYWVFQDGDGWYLVDPATGATVVTVDDVEDGELEG